MFTRVESRLPNCTETGDRGACRTAREGVQRNRRDAEEKTCDAITGIIEEGQEVMKEFKDVPALDAGILAAAQAVRHYEIARYGTLKTWAGELTA